MPSINVVQLAPVASPKVGYDPKGTNENDVVFRDRDWPYQTQGVDTFELVTTNFERQTGELLDSDVEINGAKLPLLLQASDGGILEPASSRLKRLFVHIAGHFLGFAHSPFPDSVMFDGVVVDDTSELTEDAAAGMCAAYPPDGARPTLDAEGNPISIRSTACSLGAAVPASTCSSSSLRIDHGCSVTAPRSASHDGNEAFVLASVVLFVARRRRERAVSAMA